MSFFQRYCPAAVCFFLTWMGLALAAPARDEGLVGHWPFDECRGVVSADAGPLKRDARLSNAAWARGAFGSAIKTGPSNTRYRSIRGWIGSYWRKTQDQVILEVTVPPGSIATIELPASDPDSILEAGIPVSRVDGVRRVGGAAGKAVLEIGSGRYTFTATYKSAGFGKSEAEMRNESAWSPPVRSASG